MRPSMGLLASGTPCADGGGNHARHLQSDFGTDRTVELSGLRTAYQSHHHPTSGDCPTGLAPLPILVTAPSSHTVLVLGAGLAGLTTAYHLHQQGYHITLLDHPDWLDGFRTDASQPAPIVLGCHHETRRVLRALDRGRPSEADQNDSTGISAARWANRPLSVGPPPRSLSVDDEPLQLPRPFLAGSVETLLPCRANLGTSPNSPSGFRESDGG